MNDWWNDPPDDDYSIDETEEWEHTMKISNEEAEARVEEIRTRHAWQEAKTRMEEIIAKREKADEADHDDDYDYAADDIAFDTARERRM